MEDRTPAAALAQNNRMGQVVEKSTQTSMHSRINRGLQVNLALSLMSEELLGTMKNKADLASQTTVDDSIVYCRDLINTVKRLEVQQRAATIENYLEPQETGQNVVEDEGNSQIPTTPESPTPSTST